MPIETPDSIILCPEIVFVTSDSELMDNKEALRSLADDSMKIFRINIVLLTVFFASISLVYRGGGEQYVNSVANSSYTATAAFAWFGSTLGSIYSYRSSNRLLIEGEYSNEGVMSDELMHLNTVSAVASTTLLSLLSLVFGLIDGIIRGGLPVIVVLITLSASHILVTFIFNFFRLLVWGRKSAPDIFWDIYFGRWEAVREWWDDR